MQSLVWIGAAVALAAVDVGTVEAAPRQFPLKEVKKTTPTICCYCGVGCGAIVTEYEDGSIKIDGDPDHPINQGSLCPKGMAMLQIHCVDGKLNPERLTRPLYRKRSPGSG
ncbi:MAG: hypothetical protein NTU41_01230 [Chloroflexi bacterium]|nr:hypothetical protein [Chloroflexota bacterium]